MSKITLLLALLISTSAEGQDGGVKAVAPDNRMVVLISGEITHKTIPHIKDEVRVGALANRELVILIDSTGGEIFAGLELVKYFKIYPKPIICVVDVDAMSTAFIILQHCPIRFATKRAKFMIHEPYASEVTGNARQLLAGAIELNRLTKYFVKIITEKTRIPEEYLMEKILDKDWLFNAEEALDMGVIDGFIEPKDISKLGDGNFKIPKVPALLVKPEAP